MNHNDIIRGEEAHRLLESRIFKEAMQDIQAEIVRQWRAEEDMEIREKLHADSRAVDRITNAIKKIADNGRFAADRLNKLERK